MRELFGDFEVNREPRWPVLLRLIGASVVFHTAVLASVIFVPTVRNAFNIAAMLSDTGYADRPYSKTRVGEDVQMLAFAHEKFRYPDGYFALQTDSGASAASPVPDSFSLKIVSQAGRGAPGKVATPSPSPSPVPSPSPEVPSPDLAASAASPAPSASNPVDAKASSATPKNAAQVEQELNKIAADNSVVRPNENEINTRPLKDWLARTNELKLKGELDLSSQVEITIEAHLTTDCRLGEANIVRKAGDERLVSVARDMVSAISDSGMLSFLRDPKKVTDSKVLRCDEIPFQMTLKLDQSEITARVESEADSPERAAEMAKGYSGLLTVGQLLKSGHDEEVLYRNTNVAAQGKQIVVNFRMPRETANEMIKKQLPAS